MIFPSNIRIQEGEKKEHPQAEKPDQCYSKGESKLTKISTLASGGSDDSLLQIYNHKENTWRGQERESPHTPRHKPPNCHGHPQSGSQSAFKTSQEGHED